MAVQLQHVADPLQPDAQRESLWRCIAPQIEPHMSFFDGTHTLQDVRAKLAAGTFQLWLNGRTVALTEITPYPQLRSISVALAVGTGDDLLATRPELQDWSRQFGYSRLEIRGRDGWLRALGLRRSYSVMCEDFDR